MPSFREELIQDMTDNALRQKPDASDEEILKAIQYYNKRDSFLMLTSE